MKRQAKIFISPSFLSIKGEELFVIFCNVVTIKAKVPTRHEQAPFMKKVISAFNIYGTGIVSDYVHMSSLTHYRHSCLKHRTIWTASRFRIITVR